MQNSEAVRYRARLAVAKSRIDNLVRARNFQGIQPFRSRYGLCVCLAWQKLRLYQYFVSVIDRSVVIERNLGSIATSLKRMLESSN